MINFKISLLLAFNLNPPMAEGKKKHKTKKGKKSKHSDQSSKKHKKGKTSKSEKEKKKGKKETTPKKEPDLKDYEFKMDKPLGYVHINYNLLPHFKYKIDVVCWGPIAKIYTVDGQTCFKTIIKDGIAWVPVFLEHSRNPLQINEIEKYKDHIIRFSLDASKKKVATKAKNDKTKMFYIKEEDVLSENFVEAYDVNPNLEHTSLEKKRLESLAHIKNLMSMFTNSPSDVKIDTWVHSPNEVHSYNMLNIIKRISNGDKIDCREQDHVEPKEKKTKKEKKQKDKKKKGGSKKEKKKGGSKKHKQVKILTSMNVKIPAKLLYTDPILVTYRLGTSIPAINHAFILLSSKHLMSVSQKLELSPFVMKVLKISNFPRDILKQNGFDNIYVSCEIPNLINFKTPVKPVAETIRVLESQIVFIKDKPKRKMFTYLQTQKVKLQIYGVKTKLLESKERTGVFTPRSELSSKASGSRKNSNSSKSSKSSKSKSKSSSKKSSSKKSSSKKSSKSLKSSKKSKKGKKDENEDTLLALGMFDASSLLDNVWMLKEKGQCHNPNILVAQKGIELVKFIDRYTVQEGNMIIAETIPTPLNEELLLRLGTTIKLEAFFLAPQYPSSSIMKNPYTFKRLLMIIFDVDTARLLLNLVFLHNQDLTRMETFIPNPIMTFVEGQRSSSQSSVSDDKKDVLTGFVIDSDMGNFIMYLEGLSNGFILAIFHQIHSLNPAKAKLFYNSEYIFDERLFPRCTLLVYSIALKIPLEDMLKRPEIYIEGNVPLAGWKAILKLYLICTSHMFKSILQSSLLPTEQELCCLNDEFGVVFRYMGDLVLDNRSSSKFSGTSIRSTNRIGLLHKDFSQQ